MNGKNLFAGLAIALVAMAFLFGCASEENAAPQEVWQNPPAAQVTITTSEQASEQMAEVSNTMSVLIAELESIDSEM